MCKCRVFGGSRDRGPDKAQKSGLRNVKVEGIFTEVGSYWFRLSFPLLIPENKPLTFTPKLQNPAS